MGVKVILGKNVLGVEKIYYLEVVVASIDPYTSGLPVVGKNLPSAKALQSALKAAGFMPQSVKLSDNYGPSTQKAVTEMYRVRREIGHQGNQIEAKGWAWLRGTPLKDRLAEKEPAHDYTHTVVSGKTVNRRTAAMLHSAELVLGRISVSCKEATIRVWRLAQGPMMAEGWST